MILFLFWLIAGRHFGYSASKQYSVIDNFIGLFYAQGGARFMDWGIPMWFLPALFLTTLCYYPISFLTIRNRILIIVLMGIIGFWVQQILNFHLLWSLDVVPVLLVFFGVGNIFGQLKLSLLSKPKQVGLLILFLCIHTLGFIFNTKVNIYDASYGNYALMLIGGTAGTLWMLLLFFNLPSNRYVTWVGQNSLIIMIFHLTAMTFIKGVALISNFEIVLTPINSLLYAMLQIIILVPVIYILNNYFPVLVGKSSKKG